MNFLLYKKNIFVFFLSILFLLEGCGGPDTTAARIYKDTFSGNDQVECFAQEECYWYPGGIYLGRYSIS